MEYARFGDGWVKRKDDGEEWAACAVDDVPAEVFAEESRAQVRRDIVAAGGRGDPFDKGGDLAPGSTVLIGNREGRQGQATAVRLPNPEVDALAGELGLTPEEFRGRLNAEPGGTRNRVSEERFDEIAKRVGLDPEEARSRFRDGRPRE